jgi:hypothetical protein
MSAKHYQVLIIYIYTVYIPLAFNKYSILTLFHTINYLKYRTKLYTSTRPLDPLFITGNCQVLDRYYFLRKVNNSLFNRLRIGRLRHKQQWLHMKRTTVYIPLAFNKYSILTLFHTINDPLIQIT